MALQKDKKSQKEIRMDSILQTFVISVSKIDNTKYHGISNKLKKQI